MRSGEKSMGEIQKNGAAEGVLLGGVTYEIEETTYFTLECRTSPLDRPARLRLGPCTDIILRLRSIEQDGRKKAR